MAAQHPQPLQPRVSAEDWASMPEEEKFELVAGELEAEEVPDYVHEVIVAWLIRVLGGWVCPRGGFIAASEARFILSPEQGRKPDVSVFLPGGARPPRRGPVRIPPDLAVEVISPRARDVRRDRIDKHDAYARFGVRQYWLVDPEARTLEIWRLNERGTYERLVGAAAGAVVVEGLDGLVVDLDALWAETDRLGE